ncbi:MAG: hypothetical protein A3H37_09310 [Candidatus Schekmanbacteria bacterium RIFCSPLOWO2_02_FULL_38_14]|uniref:Ferredoxin--NADP reductase n=1 Tax=Candidatus Schekmanbacteria bacterium RIFCSPLOWO2_12_FULL_38_15 TaxID=1817883 RepID=A0A1F7SCF3_9BACT|nr:MAG: hypothetical protein A3G31_06255 [Candidatus Schekmanbacteria bacterium RIFCSPLOWO2_12_FULL_38_15]OGL51544.1 MAG: hypothetical protein A3H37_09310 [Candidatus Schekmanbacteria bacterium RIFCSPLOWO2_02_FULL_38_14]
MAGRKKFDVIIVGAGAAGLTAGIFCRMRKLSTLIIDYREPGGQLTSVYSSKPIMDYPSYDLILAAELAGSIIRQTKKLGIDFISEERAEDIKPAKDGFDITTSSSSYRAKAVILSMGIGVFKPRALGIIGEQELIGCGVAYGIPEMKAVKDKRILCVGGGNSSLEAALTTKDAAKEVTLIHRNKSFEAYEFYREAIMNSKVKVKFHTELKEILGAERVNEAILFNREEKKYEKLKTDMVVINAGLIPNFKKLKDWGLEVDSAGVKVDSEMMTSKEGIFACGDMVSYKGKLKLLISASGEGSIAAESAFKYISERSK